MRVAALFDIHANLPALEAVLHDVHESGADRIVVGGDVLPGPMPRETLRRLLDLDLPVHFIHGNGELAVLAQITAMETGYVSYWGTTSGRPLPELDHQVMRWTAEQLRTDYEVFACWPKTLRLEIGGLGTVLFCHATPRSETEIFTRLTPANRLLPIIEEAAASIVVCGHTHMSFQRRIGNTLVLNPGSVGMPFGTTGAHWALLGPTVQLRRTSYDLEKAAERIRSTRYPRAMQDAHDLLEPPDEGTMLEQFGRVEVGT